MENAARYFPRSITEATTTATTAMATATPEPTNIASTTVSTNVEAPSAHAFSVLIQELCLEISLLLPIHVVCTLWTTCGEFALWYLPLLTKEGQDHVNALCLTLCNGDEKLVNEKLKGIIAHQTFTRCSDYRLPDYMLYGPGGEKLYAQHKGFVGGSLTFCQLRDRTLYVDEVIEREKNPAIRWTELKKEYIKQYEKQTYSITAWLEKQLTPESALLGAEAYMKKYVFDGSLPMKNIVDLVQKNESSISYVFLMFSSFLLTKCNNQIFDSNKDELTPTNLTELFQSFWESGTYDLSRIWHDSYVKKALKNRELKLSPLLKANRANRLRELNIILEDPVIQNDLKSGARTIVRLIEVATPYFGFSSLLKKSLGQELMNLHFISDQASFVKLIDAILGENVRHENFICLVQKVVLPMIKKDIDQNQLERNQVDWLNAFWFINQNKEWLSNIKMYSYHYRVPASDCRNLIKLNLSLTTQAVQNCTIDESQTIQLTMPKLIELIVEEEKILSQQVDPECIDEGWPWYGVRFTHASLMEVPFCNVLNQCEITPFHYAQIALSLMDPEFAAQFKAGKLDLEEFNEKLKADPLYGYRIALFGLSNQYTADEKKCLEENFARILSHDGVQILLGWRTLSMEQLFEIARRNRSIKYKAENISFISFFDIVERVSFKESADFTNFMLQRSDDAILWMFRNFVCERTKKRLWRDCMHVDRYLILHESSVTSDTFQVDK